MVRTLGYDLTRLICGGTLAVITEITLALMPLPPATGTGLAYFRRSQTRLVPRGDDRRGLGARHLDSSIRPASRQSANTPAWA